MNKTKKLEARRMVLSLFVVCKTSPVLSISDGLSVTVMKMESMNNSIINNPGNSPAIHINPTSSWAKIQ